MVETLLLAGLNAGVIGSAGTAVAIGQGASLIGGAFTAASAFGSIMGGNQGAAVAKAQAQQYELSARQEELRGRQQADNIRRSLQATLASQNAAFAARGISLSSGSPVNLGTVSRNEASNDIHLAQFGSSMSASAERASAGQKRLEATSSKIAGYTNAASSLYAGRNSFGSLIS